jgi:hypothetical protein
MNSGIPFIKIADRRLSSTHEWHCSRNRYHPIAARASLQSAFQFVRPEPSKRVAVAGLPPGSFSCFCFFSLCCEDSVCSVSSCVPCGLL